ncbi:2-oxoacid:acceptor oxidoreductase delta subunit (pyruvate/2-ketoisovalerate family) [Streptomyces sp. 846.5]|nr:4Fe-4S binding protein [Streptomyces sp. 846.5]TDT97356.1 2-oxoacid:acceptor oxidoreductase delta subunit (pyruvate/2-ketoisovalerate family) [Streptomyces sp. 846.5]
MNALTPFPYRVVDRRRENADTVTLDLEPVLGLLPPYRAGQFSMVYAFGVGEVPISVSGIGPQPGRLSHTIRAVGKVTEALCAARTGDVLGLRGPYGQDWALGAGAGEPGPDTTPLGTAPGEDLLVIAGGVGLAPLRPVLRTALAGAGRYGWLTVLAGARSPDELIHRQDLAEWHAGRGELEEGVRMKWLSTIAHADESRITIERMRLDDSGFPQPTGEFEELDADTVVLALGQDSDLSLLEGVPDPAVAHGSVEVGQGLMTGCPGIFAGGDMVPAERTVTVAVGHGKKAARHINAYLRGGEYRPPEPHRPATFDRLNTWYYADAPASVRPRLQLARRTSTFDEVVGGLDESTALFEARRCMSCGNCFECDNCYGVCPDNAITKLGPGRGFAIDLDYCKGCGLCAAECPSGAIEMVPEE